MDRRRHLQSGQRGHCKFLERIQCQALLSNATRHWQVLHVHPHSVLFTRKPRSGWVIFHEMEETKKTQCVLKHSSSTSLFMLIWMACRIRVLTEIEPDW